MQSEPHPQLNLSLMPKKKKYVIRKAVPTDVVALLKLFKEITSESPIYNNPDDADCIQWFLNVIAVQGAWVAVSNRKIVGSIGCLVDYKPWNHQEQFVYNCWYHVSREYRKGYRISAELLSVARNTAHEAGLPFHLSINSAIDKRTDRFIRMQGFTYEGGGFVSSLALRERENGEE